MSLKHKGPRVIRMGSAAEVAADALGYVNSGESQYTRRISHVENRTVFSNRVTKRKGHHTLSELIAEVRSALAHMRGAALIEDSDERRTRLEKQIGIKAKFLARLELEDTIASRVEHRG
jgi:hypothetical protein